MFYQKGQIAALQTLGLTKQAASRRQVEEPYEARLQRRFTRLQDALKRYGDEVDTGHKRILFPKRVLAEQDIENLGFVPVLAAIPEAGQSAFRSYRHPDNKYHIHEHDDAWTMHRDEEAASTMLTHKANSRPGVGLVPKALRTAAGTLKGLPHTILEGLPGLGYYIKGRLGGGLDMRQRIVQKANPEFFKEMATWKPLSPVTPPT